MRRYYVAAAALLALFIVACSIERADARPLPAHHVVAGFGAAHCLPSGVWQATLTVTSDVPGGTAHLQPQGVTGFNLPMPVSNVFSIGPNVATYTVNITVTWPSPDEFVSTLSATATRPADGCTVPTTSTTTCEQAIPVRDDCEVTTSTSPSTSTPVTQPTIPVTTSLPIASTATVTSTTTISPAKQPATSSSPSTLFLPTTGSSSSPLAGIAAGIALTGCALLLIGARRKGVER